MALDTSSSDHGIYNLIKYHKIWLVGCMGAGKSTVGFALAELMSRRFIDTDDEIVRWAGRPIMDVVRRYGWSYFRGVERMVGLQLSRSDDQLVIGTGGGLLVHSLHIDEISRQDAVIHLDASPEVAWSRIQHTDRPLISTWDQFAELCAFRQQIYQKAPIQINADASVDQVVRSILGRLLDGSS